VETTLYSGSLASTDTGDSGEYQFLGAFTASRTVRCTGLVYFKTATEVEIPHELRLFDVDYSTVTPLVSVLAVDGASGSTGYKVAPVIGDLRAGHNYKVSAVIGAGADAGYSYTAGFGFPLSSGSITMTEGGFCGSHANISSVTNPTTYYTGVNLRWQEPSANWKLLSRNDPAIMVGTSRTITSTVIPS